MSIILDVVVWLGIIGLTVTVLTLALVVAAVILDHLVPRAAWETQIVQPRSNGGAGKLVQRSHHRTGYGARRCARRIVTDYADGSATVIIQRKAQP